MAKTEKLQTLHSDVSDLRKLPRPTGDFYVFLVDEGWPTVASQVVTECREVFGRALREHLLIVAEPNLTEQLRLKYDIATEDDPTIILTDIPPEEFDSEKHQANGLRVSLAKLTDRNSIVSYMQRVARTINEPDFNSSMAWFDRRKKIAKALEKIPILNLVGLL